MPQKAKDTVSVVVSALLDGRGPFSVAATSLSAPGVVAGGARPVGPPVWGGGVVRGRRRSGATRVERRRSGDLHRGAPVVGGGGGAAPARGGGEVMGGGARLG